MTIRDLLNKTEFNFGENHVYQIFEEGKKGSPIIVRGCKSLLHLDGVLDLPIRRIIIGDESDPISFEVSLR